MNKSAKYLFISNGYGEDIVSAHIANTFLEYNPQSTIMGFPTVGSGKFYIDSGIKLAGKGPELPSEGFVRSLKDFFVDVKKGFFLKTLKLGLSLRKVSQNFDYLIITGDPYLLLFTSMFTPHKKKNRIFIGIQQSEWYGSKKPFKQHYCFIERQWLKWFSGLVFVRDHKTEDYLRTKGLDHVTCTGNPMMDCFTISNQKQFPRGREVIGILPGSKKEAYENLKIIFAIIRNLYKRKIRPLFAIALSPNLKSDTIVKEFKLENRTSNSNDINNTYTVYKWPESGADIVISQKIFGDIINESKAVIGLSGTGNEQAAGLGKPVFSFWGKGPQITEKFLVAQKRLLGPSLFIYPPEPDRITEKIIETINDSSLLKKIKENGKMRMAGVGSIDLLVKKIKNYIMVVL